MARNTEEGGGSQRSSSPTLRLRSRPDPFLVVCRSFNVLTALIALLCVFVNVLSAIRSFKDGSDIFGGILRCYAVVLALFVAFTETEWSFIFKFWKVLEYWVGRGMLQIFVAVMTRAYPDVSGKRKDLVLLQEISSYLLLACGLTYIISGVLCIGFLKRARLRKEITRDQAAKDLAELERRREELEALLVAERT
ncbi:vacuole protein [Tasmannia lanceolata]|uniref:vacuole protein n=1 Tax=Tasmannia lanceolata TaxID=3420 RepID=UPI004063CC26